MNYFLVIPALLLFQSSCKPVATPTTAVAEARKERQLPADWKTYEDDWFRINHPPDSYIGGAKNGKQNPKFPTFAAIPRSEEPGGGLGAFTLQFDVQTNGMMLRDAIQFKMSAYTKDKGTLLTPAREIKVGNGRCMSAVASRPEDRCPKDQGSCYSASILTLCEDFAGRRYLADSILSHGNDPKQLSAPAQQEAATYERILRSLEFKKS